MKSIFEGCKYIYMGVNNINDLLSPFFSLVGKLLVVLGFVFSVFTIIRKGEIGIFLLCDIGGKVYESKYCAMNKISKIVLKGNRKHIEGIYGSSPVISNMIQEYGENYYEDIYIQKFYYLQIFSNIDEQVVGAIITSRGDELDIILPSFPTRWSFGNMGKLNKTTFIEIRSNPMHLVDTYINSAHHFFVYAETYMADAIVLPGFHLLFGVNELGSNVKYISTDQNIGIGDYDDDFWLLTGEDLRNSLVLNEFYEHDSPNYYGFFLGSPLMITGIDKIDIKYTPGYQ